MFKRHFAVGLLVLMMIFSVHNITASTLSVQIEQIDKLHNDVTETTLLIEETILEHFFSQAMIVTTCPIIVDSATSKTGYAFALNDARKGYSDFLIYVSIFYDTENPSGEKFSIEDIDSAQWKIIRISDNTQTASGKLVPKQTKSENKLNDIKYFGKQIAASINSSIQNK